MAGILVIAEHRQGALRPASLEIIAAALPLKPKAGALAVAIVGSALQAFVPELSVEGVDEIVTVTVASEVFQPDVQQAAVAALIEARKPSVVLIAHGVDAWSYAPAIAASAGYGFATDVFEIAYDGDDLVATRAGYKEKVRIELDFPGKSTVLLTVRTNSFKPAAGSSSPTVTAFAAPSVEARTSHTGWKEPAASGGIDIPGAEFIVSIGRGVGDETKVEQFLELADGLGAVLGCSRPIADNGWLPKARQVGQSGKLAANCKLYVALGISGSVQHLWGMKHVETIIAVNSDPEASIFSVARYGVVGDMFEIAEELQALQ
jgi:electron transfer flavoprotein alpha subunit